jgi:hypothetical protein
MALDAPPPPEEVGTSIGVRKMLAHSMWARKFDIDGCAMRRLNIVTMSLC